jgi:hypothetical protein
MIIRSLKTPFHAGNSASAARVPNTDVENSYSFASISLYSPHLPNAMSESVVEGETLKNIKNHRIQGSLPSKRQKESEPLSNNKRKK